MRLMESSGATGPVGGPRPRGRMEHALYGVLLAGGISSRMGRDKAALKIGGHGLSQAGRALRLLRQICARTYLSLRIGQVVPPGAEGVPVLRDEPSVEGPLAGILAAFREAPQAAWLVLACDLPFVGADLLAQLLACHEEHPDLPFVACAKSIDGLPEPLCAIYGPSAGPILARHAVCGQFSPCRIMTEESALLVPVADEVALTNVNTPQDLAAAHAMANLR